MPGSSASGPGDLPFPNRDPSRRQPHQAGARPRLADMLCAFQPAMERQCGRAVAAQGRMEASRRDDRARGEQRLGQRDWDCRVDHKIDLPKGCCTKLGKCLENRLSTFPRIDVVPDMIRCSTYVPMLSSAVLWRSQPIRGAAAFRWISRPSPLMCATAGRPTNFGPASSRRIHMESTHTGAAAETSGSSGSLPHGSSFPEAQPERKLLWRLPSSPCSN